MNTSWNEVRENRAGTDDDCDVWMVVGWVGVRREQRAGSVESSTQGRCGYGSLLKDHCGQTEGAVPPRLL